MTPQAAKPPVVLRVPRLPKAVPRGKFPAADAWKTAPVAGPLIRQKPLTKAPSEEVEARVLHDGARLFLRVISPLPPRGLGQLRRPRTPGQEQWRMPCVEVYFAPKWGRKPWFMFIFNSRHLVADSKGYDRGWNCKPDWHARSRAVGKRWVLEVAIPFEAVQMKSAGNGATCALKLLDYTAKNRIFIWPPLKSVLKEGRYRGRHPVVQSADPTGYAQLVLE